MARPGSKAQSREAKRVKISSWNLHLSHLPRHETARISFQRRKTAKESVNGEETDNSQKDIWTAQISDKKPAFPQTWMDKVDWNGDRRGGSGDIGESNLPEEYEKRGFERLLNK